MLIATIVLIGLGFIVIERLWPANALPRVRVWYLRVIATNVIQGGIVVLAGLTWDIWLNRASLVGLEDHIGVLAQATVAYIVSSFVYYWWHRWRHASQFWWTLCHQLHHSPRRIEILTSFYKHPVEITLNSILSAAIIYALLGITVEAAAIHTGMTACWRWVSRDTPLHCRCGTGWACLFNRNVLISNPSIAYVGLLLLLTTLVPAREPFRIFGSEAASDEFYVPSTVYWAAWWLMAAGYTFSGVAKLSSPSWIDGTALWHVLHNPLARDGLARDSFSASRRKRCDC